MSAYNHTAFGKLLNKNVPHILEHIFLSLDYWSFRKCHKVCSAWSEMLGTESFKRKSRAQYHDEMVGELIDAAYYGNAKEVNRILSIGISPNVTGEYFTLKTTPLMMAMSAYIHNINVVKILLRFLC